MAANNSPITSDSHTGVAANAGDHHVHVAIIGTGFSGLGLAIRMKQAGLNDFAIFERASDVGGTWRDNSYPGCACDVPSKLYSFSFAPNADWSASYSPQAEIWQYLRRCAADNDLLPHIHFNHEVMAAKWDADAGRWQIDTAQGTYFAEVLIGGMGILSEPAIPELPGLNKFRGETFHSADWNHEYDLSGKRVAVIGTGASAIQFVPQIQPRVKSMTLFQRSAPWILPRTERKISAFERRLYERVPLLQKVARGGIYTMVESRVIGMAMDARMLKPFQLIAQAHLKRQVKNAQLRAKLTPNYAIGCKRILLSNNYYPALTQPNVEVVTEGVAELRENSVIASDGSEYEVDAVIWGTGFHVSDSPMMERIYGNDGRQLSAVFDGSPQAFLGTAVAGFPNMFLMIGPNTTLGHNSMVYMIESHITYILGCLRYMQRQQLAAVEVKPDAQARFNQELQDKMGRTVWMSGGCTSWYIDAKGRNTVLWPSFTWQFRNQTRYFDASAYKQQPLAVATGSGTKGKVQKS
ncbi:MAG: NAD(P)/FAD-dependent oxidoreductase [Thermoleophilaceae bacterium]|nr:NAD(P)/FAD-dependent oxidoreductase [Thermoleophilaceae bacterium]